MVTSEFKKKMKSLRCFFMAMILLLFAGCRNDKEVLVFDREITMKFSPYQDTVHTALVIRNRGNEIVGLTLIPECDCTVVHPETLHLKPHSRQRVDVSYYVNTVGYYEKIVYLEWNKTGVTDTVVIRGNVQK